MVMLEDSVWWQRKPVLVHLIVYCRVIAMAGQ